MKKLILGLLLLPTLIFAQQPDLNKSEAKKLMQLPEKCIQTEYPNKLGQTLTSAEDLGTPKDLHPAFYGCFDWHSAVHGMWSLVTLTKEKPEIDENNLLKNRFIQQLSQENIIAEIKYFENESEYSYERTYGWAWLFKLQQTLDDWDTSIGKQLSENLKPLTNLLVERFIEYLPKLNYPIRVGTHTNTAFAMSFAYDYALSSSNFELQQLIEKRANDFYLNDENCPIGWEPNGYDFLSPCIEEVDLMRKVLPKDEFFVWINKFLPKLIQPTFNWEVGEVSDRTDGHLVHLDGLNFSRAWVFYGLANQYNEFQHLIPLANKHFYYSYPNLIGDAYEGGHWLASFALYAIISAKNLSE